ncbi:MAG: leucyl/phenylalanyl-tRNA--protein transferase [Hydrogenophilales bacterium 16-64-46]|nr:MAG: leucyl/phenylalanyl-tRNA--protein transferase [Hydrogenophilales bacterium 12-64-13]OYZ05123.1 MAG: leucyl/phenylalanyl-tRNA--protein transferase [Hydrogenophilales bacterium 16-64-46]OZA37941.1 MAG: leucyl/phenylalanyl-tRNA--protein transferase [Hydrogenophilales bacterium 17-64-34]HQT00529.1 leucyl/phenylalanyl-tRNA--protein transferase [Thiobacillus sp.]
MSERSQNATRFPPVDQALVEPNGLLARGGDLAVATLLDAYRHGIFPWFSPGEPILWWSPDPRMVLVPGDVRVTRSLAKRLRNGGFELRVDTVFAEVMRGCAGPRADAAGTWISPAMIAAYTRLFETGYAHSVETWRDGRLVGGLYGVAIGRMFYGESMFSREPDASKVALVGLARQLARWEFGLIDCQMETAHLASLGARPMPRADFVERLAELVNLPHRSGPWSFDVPD